MQSLIAAHAPRSVVFALCGPIYHKYCGFSTDPQQTSKSPPIQILSNYLETSVGNYSSWALFAIIPAVAVYFDVVGRIEVGIKMAAWGHVFLELGMGIVFWVGVRQLAEKGGRRISEAQFGEDHRISGGGRHTR